MVTTQKLDACHPDFKSLCGHLHVKCNKGGRHRSSLVYGKRLNYFLKKDHALNAKQKYQVCYGVGRRIKDIVVPKHYCPNPKVVAERRSRRQAGEQPTPPSPSINSCSLALPSSSHTATLPTINKEYRHRGEIAVDNILNEGLNYKIQYSKLSMRERARRTKLLAEKVIASCVNKAELILEGEIHLHDNLELAVDVITCLDTIRDKCQYLLKMNLSKLTNEGQVTPPPDESKKIKTGAALFGETSQNGYERLRREIASDFDTNVKNIPSFYMMTKNRPNVKGVMMKPIDLSAGDDVELELSLNATSRTNLEPTQGLIPIQSVSCLAGRALEIEDAFNILRQKDLNEDVESAKLDGNYDTWIGHLFDKKKDTIGPDKNVIIIDSYDGAEHQKIKKKKTGVVSFSSKMFNSTTIKQEGGSCAGSLNILTWQQYIGDEKLCNLIPALDEVYKRKKAIRDNGMDKLNGGRASIYDLHDGKMLYLLTQHSLFNRKHHPFLLCKCHRGEGVTDSEHVCTPILHADQIKYWERSKRRWDNKRERSGNDAWSKKQHMDWIDTDNFGISHFGFHPDELRRDSLRFDVFHLRCAVTRRIMSCLRAYMMKQTTDIMSTFSDLLLTFWSEYNVLIWNINKPFASMTGSKLLSFIEHTPQIIDFLTSNFVATDTLNNLCDSLQLWTEITPFLVITTIDDKDDYNKKLAKFEKDVKHFYSLGRTSFLTKKEDGDDETFYTHVLRFYQPKIANETRDMHNLGIGIFTMQGFEHRNKESKNTLKRFNNMKGNKLIQNIRRLWDVFYHNTNSY